jgi:hypothetical protein
MAHVPLAATVYGMESSEPGASAFEFITDEHFRGSLQNDYAELLACVGAQAWKAALVTSGSV